MQLGTLASDQGVRVTAIAGTELVLHEYYHVTKQWNNSRMNNFTYLTNSAKWELEARNFGSQNAGVYQFFLGRP